MSFTSQCCWQRRVDAHGSGLTDRLDFSLTSVISRLGLRAIERNQLYVTDKQHLHGEAHHVLIKVVWWILALFCCLCLYHGTVRCCVVCDVNVTLLLSVYECFPHWDVTKKKEKEPVRNHSSLFSEYSLYSSDVCGQHFVSWKFVWVDQLEEVIYLVERTVLLTHWGISLASAEGSHVEAG